LENNENPFNELQQKKIKGCTKSESKDIRKDIETVIEDEKLRISSNLEK